MANAVFAFGKIAPILGLNLLSGARAREKYYLNNTIFDSVFDRATSASPSFRE